MKIHPRESYDEALNRLLDMAYDPEPLSEETLKKIEEGIADIRAGRGRPFEEVVRERGLEWSGDWSFYRVPSEISTRSRILTPNGLKMSSMLWQTSRILNLTLRNWKDTRALRCTLFVWDSIG
jgi:hypothetical protein